MLEIKPVTSARNTDLGQLRLEREDSGEFQYRLAQIETASHSKRRSSQKSYFKKYSKSDASPDVRLLDVGLSFIPDLDREKLLRTGQTLRQIEILTSEQRSGLPVAT